jgi:hypothetical protein
MVGSAVKEQGTSSVTLSGILPCYYEETDTQNSRLVNFHTDSYMSSLLYGNQDTVCIIKLKNFQTIKGLHSIL